MKTKSKLVLGLSILSDATLAAGATSTFAWWTVNATAVQKTTVQQIETKESAIAQGNYYLAVAYTGTAPTTVEMTDKNGDCWVVSQGHIVAAAAAADANKSGSLTNSYAFHLYSDAGMQTEITGTELTNALLSIGQKTYDIMATPTGKVRVSLYAAGTQDHAKDVYAANLLEGVKVGILTISDQGAASITNNVACYYSVSGNSDNTVPSPGDAANEDKTGGTIVISLAPQNNG